MECYNLTSSDTAHRSDDIDLGCVYVYVWDMGYGIWDCIDCGYFGGVLVVGDG